MSASAEFWVPPASTVPEAIAWWAANTPKAPALLAVTGLVVSFGALQRRITEFGAILASIGIERTDRVALALPDGVPAATAGLATIRVAVAAPVNPTQPLDEAIPALESIQPRAVIVAEGVETPWREAAQRSRVPVLALDETGSVASVVSAVEPGGGPPRHPAASDLALVLLTSGTTDRPRRVPVSHSALFDTTVMRVRARGHTRENRGLNSGPAYSVVGLSRVVESLLAGGSAIVASAREIVQQPEAIRDLSPTWAWMNPALLETVLQATRENPAFGAWPLRFVRSGGAQVTPDLIARGEALWNVPVLSGYGTTETLGYIASEENPERTPRKLGSVGWPRPGLELVIRDAAGAPLPVEATGEITVRGRYVFTGYLDDPDATAAAFYPGGWHRTGDLGHLDEEGYLFVTGRSREMINRGGEKIVPHEIDEVLRAHPAVADAAAFALPDARLGEDIAIAVVVRDGFKPTPRELRHWMLDRLAPYKAPRRIWFVDALPRTGTGKVRRGELAQRFATRVSRDDGLVRHGDDAPVVLALRRWAEETPRAPALLAPDWETRDYHSLATDVERLAATLGALGIRRQEPVVIVLPEGPALVTMLLATMTAAVAAPLPWGLTHVELARALDGNFARAMIVPIDAPTPARACAEEAGVPVFEMSTRPAPNGDAFVLDGTPVRPAIAPSVPQSDDMALIISSSGTTGRPKRIPRTHGAASVTARAMMRAKALSPDDRLLSLAPFAFRLGINAILTTIAAGASLVALPGVDMSALPGWVGAYRPTWLTTAPATLLAIAADEMASAAIRARGLRLVNAGAAGITPGEIATIERAFAAPLVHSYGMSEAPSIAGERFGASGRKPGSAGQPTHEIAIVDRDMMPLERGETGEIITRGPNVFAGYLNDPEANQAAFLPDGWFRTGDAGRLDADGVLFVTGRLKEMIKRGGLAIAPFEVEQALLAYPAVAEACVFAVPHPLLGEDVAAAVVLRPGAMVTERLLRAHVAERLSPAKVPRVIAFTTHIPKGPTGKPRRRELYGLLGGGANEAGGEADQPR